MSRDPDHYPRDVLLVATRIQGMRDTLDSIAAQLHDLYLIAHEKPTSDAPKVKASTEGYAQISPNRKALALWWRLTRRPTRSDPQPTLLSVESELDAWAADLHRLLADGDRSTARTGRPITDAELKDALAAQARRRSRGDYEPTRIVRQPGPVRR